MIRTVIVDDHTLFREGLAAIIRQEADIDVVDTARTGKEGVELAKKLKPNVILMDINMPDMDGITATQQIVRDVPSTQIVMVSVQSDTDYLRRAIQRASKDPTVHDHLGDVLARQGNLKEAVTEWERSFQLWHAASPAEHDPLETAKVQKKIEQGKVRLAREQQKR